MIVATAVVVVVYIHLILSFGIHFDYVSILPGALDGDCDAAIEVHTMNSFCHKTLQ